MCGTTKKILVALALGLFIVASDLLYEKLHLRKSDYIQQSCSECEMEVGNEDISPNRIVVQIKNIGEENLYCDFEYRIEKYQHKSWYIFEENGYTNALGIVVPKDNSYQFEIKNNFPLRKGKYRIIKTISIAKRNYAIFAEFEIE